MPAIVGAHADLPQTFERPRASLLQAIGEALHALDAEHRRRCLDAILAAVADVRQLATLLGSLEDDGEKARVRERIERLPVAGGTEEIESLHEVGATVDALIEVEELDRAEVWLQRWAESARKRSLPSWAAWEVGARQRIRLRRQGSSAALDEPFPDWAKGDHNAQHTWRFFLGIACLQQKPPEAQRAVEIFQALVREKPDDFSSNINLFAARTAALAASSPDGPVAAPSPADMEAIRRLLDDGEGMMAGFPPEVRRELDATYQVNRLYLFHRIGDWSGLLSSYDKLPRQLQRDATLLSFASRAWTESGQPRLAKALEEEVGSLRALKQPATGAAAFSEANPVEVIRSSLQTLQEVSVRDQARAWWGKEIEDGVLAAFVDGCRRLAGMAEVLASPASSADGRVRKVEENRITRLLLQLLRQRLLKLGWEVHGQAEGGFTSRDPGSGRGGVAERDLEVVRGGEDIAIAEALIFTNSEWAKLQEHYRRLFSEVRPGTPLLVLLIWCYHEDPAEVWRRHRQEVMPLGPRFQEGPIDDTVTTGVWSAVTKHHDPATGRIQVVAHLLVDLRQQAARTARMESFGGDVRYHQEVCKRKKAT
jgi:hypothetical protein